MIYANGGKQIARDYEQLSNYLSMLRQNMLAFEDNLNTLSKKIYSQFLELKEDHRQGVINDPIYIEFLRNFQSYFENINLPHNKNLKVDEVLGELKRMGIIISKEV